MAVLTSSAGGWSGSLSRRAMVSSRPGVRFRRLPICFSQSSFFFAQASRALRYSTSSRVVRCPWYLELTSPNSAWTAAMVFSQRSISWPSAASSAIACCWSAALLEASLISFSDTAAKRVRQIASPVKGFSAELSLASASLWAQHARHEDTGLADSFPWLEFVSGRRALCRHAAARGAEHDHPAGGLQRPLQPHQCRRAPREFHLAAGRIHQLPRIHQ